MEWYIYALISAVAMGLSTILCKKALFDIHVMEFRTTFKTLQLIPLMFLLPFVNFDILAWQYLYIFLIAFIAVVAGLFWTKAVKHSEISSVSPLQNISPFFLVIMSFIFLKEVLTIQQIIGIAIMIIGTYVLEVDHQISDLKGPIIKIIKTKTIHFVFIGLVLYSLTAIGDKYMVSNIDRFTYMFLIWLFMAIIYNLFSLIFHKGFKDVAYCIKTSGGTILIAGTLSFISALAYFQALTMAMVSLVIPVKRLSTLFTTIIGGELFHDHGLKIKVFACVIIILGSLLVIL